MSKLEALAWLVQQEHRQRLDQPDGKLEPYKWHPRPRPKTAIISKAAKRSMWLRLAGFGK